MRRRVLSLFALGGALIVGGISFVRIALASDESVAREELIALLHDVPLTEGALQGFPNAPVRPSIPPSRLINKPGLRGLILRISRDPRGRRTPEWLSNAALIKLVDGDFDSAVNLLDRAIRLRPSSAAPFLSDTAAVYLERARVRQQPSDLLLALAAVARACQESCSWEARFNRALALELLHLDDAARKEWRRLLDEPLSAGLREEVKNHWLSLRQSVEVSSFVPSSLQKSFERGDIASIQLLIINYPQEVRSLCEESLLGRWAQLHNGDRGQADRILALVEIIGVELSTLHHDQMLLDTVRAIRTASEGVSLQHLVEGHLKFAAGHAALRGGDCILAQALLKKAERELEEGKSPFFRWAGFYRAVCFFRSQNPGAAEDQVITLGSELELYPVFEARLYWLQGLLRISRADWVSSLQAYMRSLDLFEKVGEAGNIAAVSSLIAEDLLRLGQKELAWKYRDRALGILRKKGALQFQTILDEASEAAMRDGHYEIALYFQDEVVSLVVRQGTAHEAAEAYLRRIPIQVRLGDREAAESDFRATMDYVNKIPDAALRERLRGDSLLAICESRFGDNPTQALIDLDQALELYQSLNYRFRLVDVRRLRALVNQSLGNLSAAEEELDAGAREIESEVEELHNDLRDSYMRQVTPFFDERIRVAALKSEDPLRSLIASEEARILALPHLRRNLTLDQSNPTLWLTKVQKKLPEGTLLVVFRVLDRETLVWSVDRSGIHLFAANLGKGELDGISGEMKSDVGSQRRFRRVSSLIYERLLRPVLSHSVERLILVPDKGLWSVPFPALYNARTGRYLIEDATIAVAPCASIIFAPHRRTKGTAEVAVLAVGDPAFQRRLFPALTRLPGSRSEAESAAAAYRVSASRLLAGEGATAEAFTKTAALAEVVHFSGHAVETEGSPMLLLAPTPSHPAGVLTAREVAEMILDRTRLVVLSGCQTASSGQGEGLASLSAAFLAAGVSEVVGSLWRTQDDAAVSFFQEFHRHVAMGESGEVALRHTQLEKIANELSVSWAGYEVWIDRL
jgi:CHAT domain-containing protein